MDHHDVDAAGLNVGEKAFEGGPLESGTGDAARMSAFSDPTMVAMSSCGTGIEQRPDEPLGISARFDFRGTRNEAQGQMRAATLINDLDGSDDA